MTKDIIVRTEAEFFKALENAEYPALIIFDDVQISLYPKVIYKENIKKNRKIFEDYIKLRRKMLHFLGGVLNVS